MEAQHVLDIGLRGRSDEAILEHARLNSLVLVTGDLEFGNILRYPLGSHSGIVVSRFPNEVPSQTLNEAILEAVRHVDSGELTGNLLIVEPGKARLRKKY